jgi:hypothetical protein
MSQVATDVQGMAAGGGDLTSKVAPPSVHTTSSVSEIPLPCIALFFGRTLGAVLSDCLAAVKEE